jgi:hypothetical protein
MVDHHQWTPPSSLGILGGVAPIPRRRGGRTIPVVHESGFMTEREAAESLGIDGVAWRVTRGILHPASLADGTRGVTRSSVEAELDWQRTASRVRRFRRALGGLLQWF